MDEQPSDYFAPDDDEEEEPKPEWWPPSWPERWWTHYPLDDACERCNGPVSVGDQKRFCQEYYPFLDDRDERGNFRQRHYIVFECEARPVDRHTGKPLLLLCSNCRIFDLERNAREPKGCAKYLACLLLVAFASLLCGAVAALGR